MKTQIAEKSEIPEIDIPSIGLGTMRTGASIMAVLLQAESEDTRIDVLADLASRFGITGVEIDLRQKSGICDECGMSEHLHPYDGCDQL